MSTMMLGWGAFLLCIIASRVVHERALRSLSPEQKVALLDAFSGYRIFSVLPVLMIGVLVYGIILSWPDARQITWSVGVLLLLAWMVWAHIHVRNKLRELELPGTYRSAHVRSRVLAYLGLAMLLAVLLA